MPLPYRLLTQLLLRHARRSPRFWLGLRPAWRLLQVAEQVLAAVLEDAAKWHDARGARGAHDARYVSPYLVQQLEQVRRDLERAVSTWRSEITALNESPTLCSRCGAPGGPDFDDAPCGRCPK